MASSSSSSSKVTLKLLIDTKQEKVLFAEASKEVADFLFSLLCLPLSTVIRLLNQNEMVGSIANLYQSVQKLNNNYIQPNVSKVVLLNPKVAISSSAEITGLLLPNIDVRTGNHSLETSPFGSGYHGGGFGPATPVKKTGFVKEVVTYMVMDDLVIQPMSSISSITLLNKFNIKEVGALQEKEVELGMTQGVSLLKASLQSNTVLTDVFLKKNA